jgi:hypothetical protein
MVTLLSWKPREAVVASADVFADDVYVPGSEELLEALMVWVIVDPGVAVDAGNMTARAARTTPSVAQSTPVVSR